LVLQTILNKGSQYLRTELHNYPDGGTGCCIEAPGRSAVQTGLLYSQVLPYSMICCKEKFTEKESLLKRKVCCEVNVCLTARVALKQGVLKSKVS
jgi:hypothetical protein